MVGANKSPSLRLLSCETALLKEMTQNKGKSNAKQPVYNASIFQNQHRPGEWRLSTVCRSLTKGSSNGVKKRPK